MDTTLRLGDLMFGTACAVGSFAFLTRGIYWSKPNPHLYKLFQRPQDGMQKAIVNGQTRDVSEKLKESKRDAVIFWGSQSGTSEGFAHRLAKELRQKLHLETLVADLSDYDPESISKIENTKFAIFLLSTYGEGDPSDNAWDFMNWLKSATTNSSLSLKYAALGFGNSNYKYFNKVVDETEALLNSLGACLILPVGKADEGRNTTEEDYMEWKDRLFESLKSRMGFQEYMGHYEPAIKILSDGCAPDSIIQKGFPIQKHRNRGTMSAIASFPVTEHRQLISNRALGGECYHIEVDLSAHPEIKYKSGDHLAVWPVNPPDEVFRLLSILGLQSTAEQKILLEPTDPEVDLRLPQNTTIQALFSHYLELCGPIARQTILNLAEFAVSERVKSALRKIGGNKQTYSEFLAKTHLTFARLLEYCCTIAPGTSWSSLPLSFVVESIEPMSPRYYSISSSSITSPRRVTLTVSAKQTPLSAKADVAIPGLTSTYLSLLRDATSVSSPELGLTRLSVQGQIRRSKFKLPILSTVPLVVVAAGTGIAPMRAFLLDRARLMSVGREVGKILLFFGCRSPEVDDLYGEELTALASEQLRGKLEIIRAYSRVPEQPKRYVQHAIAERLQEVCSLLVVEEASFYVCGATTMAKDVEKVIIDGIKESQGWDDSQATEWRTSRKRARRWNEDIWG